APTMPPAENGSLGRPFDPMEVPGPGEKVNWPPRNGAVGDPAPGNLPPGTELTRAAESPARLDGGGYFSPANTSMPERAMAPMYDAAGQPISHPPVEAFYDVGPGGMPVNQAEVAPAFGQPGGGTQYQAPKAPGAAYAPNAKALTGDGTLVENQRNIEAPGSATVEAARAALADSY